MSSNANAEIRIECPFGGSLRGDWYPHAVQVALVTDPIVAPVRAGGVLTSGDVIAAKEAATKATCSRYWLL